MRCSKAWTSSRTQWNPMRANCNACNLPRREPPARCRPSALQTSLASNQANQLLQIRGLLIAQQNAVATRNQVIADREAQEAAAAENLRKGEYRASPARTW